MRRLALLLALVFPAPAAAAPLVEVPSIPAAGAGTCLTATGLPGELAHDGAAASGETVLQLLRAGPAGLVPAGTSPLGQAEFACAAVVARPDGSGLAAGSETEGPRGHIVVAARPAGGAFAAPQAVAATAGPVQGVSAALSASGDAVVAWLEEGRTGSRLRAVLRRAGGGFGRPVELASGRAPLEGLTAAMSAGGDAVVAWARVTAGYQLPYHVSVYAALAAGHGPFAPARRVGESSSGGAPSLAMDDDGRALLTLPAAGLVRVAERAPGGAFGAPVAVARPRGDSPPETAVAVGAGGRAAIAWDSFAGGAGVVTRTGAGSFGPPIVLAPARRTHLVDVFRIEAAGSGPSLGILDERRLAATVTPAGTLVAWLGPRRVAGAATTGLRTALLPASGGPIERAAFGGGLRDASTLTAFSTSDGAAGVAWLEAAPDGRARLHAALPGGQLPADAPAPAVRIGRPRSTVLRYGRPLLLPVTCSAACDVRAQGAAADGGLSLPHAGSGLLRVQPLGRPLASVRGGLVRLRVLMGAPGATRPAVRMVALRLRLRALPPVPRPRGLRAVRLPGDRIRVTWDAPGPRGTFIVWGEARRGGPPLVFDARPESHGRLALTLHHVRGVRFVVLGSFGASGRPGPTLVARVR